MSKTVSPPRPQKRRGNKQPYNGEAILSFTQPDSNGREKRYMHQESVYNIHSYF